MIGYLALKGAGVMLLMLCFFFPTLSFQAPLPLEDPGFRFLRSMGNAPPSRGTDKMGDFWPRRRLHSSHVAPGD